MSGNVIMPYGARNNVSVKYKQLGECRLQKHWHQFFEMEFFISGSGAHKINGNSYPIRKGEMHLVKLTDIHEFLFESKSELYLIQFPTSYLDEDINSVILNYSKDMIVYFDEKEFEKIEFLYKLLSEEFKAKNFYDSKITKNIITAIILMLFKKLDIKEKDFSGKNDSRINNIIIYIQNHFQHTLSLKEIAENFYMNSEYFSRYFKKHMGIGPKEYIVGIRMNYAKQLVRETKMKILDICMACGYNSMATFLRDFRYRFNCTPKQMREENKKTQEHNKKKY